jgi:hypothetical protein
MKKETKFAVFLNSVGGALIILMCVIAFNIISAQFKKKADLTESRTARRLGQGAQGR